MIKVKNNETHVMKINFWLVTIALVLQVLFGFSWLFGLPVFGIWLYLVTPKIYNRFFGTLFLFSASGVVLSTIYLLFQIDKWVVALAVLIVAALSYLIGEKKNEKLLVILKPTLNPIYFVKNYFAALTIIGNLCILVLLILARTDKALVSPWNFFGIEFFILYAVTTFVLLMSLYESKGRSGLGLVILHFFTTLSVSTIIYAVGFGFDPFIHRAAEQAMFELGSIEPKQFLYTGQYTLIVALKHLTGLSIATIDKWLVPVFASISIPLSAYYGLKLGWQVSDRLSKIAPLLFLVFPFLSITFTVPHNINVVIFIIISLLLPATNHVKHLASVLISLSLLSVLIHPLLGVPTLFLTISYLLYNKTKGYRISKYLSPIFLFFCIALALPALFGIYNLQQGIDPFQFTDPLNRLIYFTSLFADPFRQPHQIPFIWELLYSYRTFLVPTIAIGSMLLSIWTFRRKLNEIIPYLVFTLGLLTSLFFITTLFEFQNIIFYEQQEFALRLLYIVYISTIPLLFFSISKLKHKNFYVDRILPISFLALSICITISWYMSYPQLNPKVHQTGPSVSAADVDVVNFIEEKNPDGGYFVISNQMTSAAALQELGFKYYHQTREGEVLWYAIPTGGPLYTFFWDMMFNGPRREVMEGAADFTGAKNGYFIIHSYWPHSESIIDFAKPTADNFFRIRDDEVVLFEYIFN
jgi:hypothetical protein